MFFLQLQSQYASPPRGMAGDFQPQGMARAPHPQDTGMGPQYPQDMTGMGPQYPQDMTGMGPQYPQAMTGMGPQYPQDMTGMGPQYPQDMTGMGTQYPQDMTGMGTQYPQAMTGMGTQYPQAMTSAPYSQAMVRDANQQQDITNGNGLVYKDSMIISIVSCLFCWIIGLLAISKARNVSWSCLFIFAFQSSEYGNPKVKISRCKSRRTTGGKSSYFYFIVTVKKAVCLVIYNCHSSQNKM